MIETINNVNYEKEGCIMNWNYTQPVTIHFGNGVIRSLNDEIRKLGGSKGILITSPSFEKRGMTDEIKKESDGLIKVVYSQVSPNPDVKECEACISLIHENECDFVVALGGGSVLDCAKAASVICTTDKPVTAFMEDMSLLPETHLPLIAVPTTAGTGSEITSVSVLSDHEKGTKKPIFCNALYPSVAIVDPELTYSVPPYVTACTGMDVLCHAIEAYWSKHHQPICDSLAIHAARTVFENLSTAYQEPDNAMAREKMAEASVIAGLAFTIPKTTSSHACSYPLTNRLGIAHGEACALTIDTFLEINGKHDDGRLAFFAKQLGFESIGALAEEIRSLKADVGMMPDLKAFKLNDEVFEILVKESQHPNLLNNPVEITEEMLRELYGELR